jgi:hypothetical protein
MLPAVTAWASSTWRRSYELSVAPSVTVVMVAYQNEERALVRLSRDLLPTLDHYRDTWDIDLTVIDNSAEPLVGLRAAVADTRSVPASYVWNGGDNLFYGPSITQAAQLSKSSLLVYLCSSHGTMHDPTWLGDLVQPFQEDGARRIAQTGSFSPSGPPSALGFDDALPWVHVQGGVFAARTEVIVSYPYPDGPLAHYLSDVYQSLRLMAAGFELVDVPTVKSVWRRAAEPGPWKYVHDEIVSDDAT